MSTQDRVERADQERRHHAVEDAQAQMAGEDAAELLARDRPGADADAALEQEDAGDDQRGEEAIARRIDGDGGQRHRPAFRVHPLKGGGLQEGERGALMLLALLALRWGRGGDLPG